MYEIRAGTPLTFGRDIDLIFHVEGVRFGVKKVPFINGSTVFADKHNLGAYPIEAGTSDEVGKNTIYLRHVKKKDWIAFVRFIEGKR